MAFCFFFDILLVKIVLNCYVVNRSLFHLKLPSYVSIYIQILVAFLTMKLSGSRPKYLESSEFSMLSPPTIFSAVIKNVSERISFFLIHKYDLFVQKMNLTARSS